MAAIDTAAITKDITNLAEASVQEEFQAAAEDGVKLLADGQATMQLYSDQLARKEIDQDELEGDLSEDLLALATMDRLQQAGLTQIRINVFTENVVTILVRAAIAAAVAAVV